ncbi:hypothetical protein E1B28_006472 [Marasmius oreades]|uniref:Uncharacterized protein n=1 Tax=Marasmius oreades TaxID=181124 RepID=A0A9P7S6D2_9AGAR|nr:uncharacterized protein E1B28_006472 [Marasmius oreades]KAG7095767.1 hypothetical protein E1B28_006472 [Marasmius oreades]
MNMDATWTALTEIRDAGLYLMKNINTPSGEGEQAILISIYTRMLLLLTHHLFTVLSVPFKGLLERLLQEFPPIDFTAPVDPARHAESYDLRLDFLRLLLPEKRIVDDAVCIKLVQELIPRLMLVVKKIPHDTSISNEDWKLLRRDSEIVFMEMVMSDLLREFPCLGEDDIEAGRTDGSPRWYRLFRDEDENRDLFDDDEEMSDAETDSTLFVSPALIDDKQLFEEDDAIEACETPTCYRFFIDPVVPRRAPPSGESGQPLDLRTRMLMEKLAEFLTNRQSDILQLAVL